MMQPILPSDSIDQTITQPTPDSGVLPALHYLFLTAISAHAQAASDAASTPSLADATAAPTPPPVIGGATCPIDPNTMDPSAPINLGGQSQGYLQMLANLVDWNLNNPDSLSGLMALLTFFINASNDGLLKSGSQSLSLIEGQLSQMIPPGESLSDFISSLLLPNIEQMLLEQNSADSNPSSDLASVLAYAQSLLNQLNGNGGSMESQIASGIQSAINQFTQWEQGLTVSNGQYQINYNGQTLTWAQNSAEIFILLIASDSQNTGVGNKQWIFNAAVSEGQFMASYRMSLLQQILAQYASNPLMAIMLFLCVAFDSQYQTELGGFANTTNDLTNVTNNYVQPMISGFQALENQVVQEIWSSSSTPNYQAIGAQVQSFLQSLQNTNTIVSNDPVLSALESSWASNTYNSIMGSPLLQPGSSVTIPLNVKDIANDPFANNVMITAKVYTPGNAFEPSGYYTQTISLAQYIQDLAAPAINGNTIIQGQPNFNMSWLSSASVTLTVPQGSQPITLQQLLNSSPTFSSSPQSGQYGLSFSMTFAASGNQNTVWDFPTPGSSGSPSSVTGATVGGASESGFITGYLFSQLFPSGGANPSSGTGTAPSSGSGQPISPGAQAITNALQSAASLLSNQSQVVGTESSTITNDDDADIKLLDFVVDPTQTGGLMSMLNQIVQNYISH